MEVVFTTVQILKPLNVFVRLRQNNYYVWHVYIYTFPEIKGKLFHNQGT